MRRLTILAAALVLLITVGAVLGQGTSDTTLELETVSEIGRALPKSIVYEPNFERIAMVDAYGQLVLVDALTYETQHILYTYGSYNDFAFSHDGKWFALAIGTDMELYNAETGELVSKLDDPGQALRIHGPLTFSDDDNLLLFVGTHPAPQELRRFENDTSETPWIWNLTAARNEGDSTFPERREAWQFFDYRNGFVLGPENRIVAALPGRLHVLDAYSLDVLFEINTARYEQDPLNVWFSLRDNQIYVLPVYEDKLLQVNTQRGLLVEIPLGTRLTPSDLAAVGGIELGSTAQVIGDTASRVPIGLLNVFLGENYNQSYRYHPLTVTLIDLLTVPAIGDDRIQALLFVFDEQEQLGEFMFFQPYDVNQMVLSPDDDEVIVRRFTDEGERIELYSITEGTYQASITPALRDLGYYSRQQKNRILAYDQTGTIIISDFQRFDIASKKVLAEDLRYSQRFDRYFFTSTNDGIVTLSGNEWRLWNIATGEVVRREALPLRGSIIATSEDGYRYLTQFDSNTGPGVEIYDVGTDEKRTRIFESLLGRYIENVIPSPDWEHYFIIYSTNFYGPYAPSNEIAIYSMDEGQLWFMAGEDLPPADGRSYGWVNDETAYVYGEGYQSDIPPYVYGADFAPDGTPNCLLNKYPDQASELAQDWYTATLFLDGSEIALLANQICSGLTTTSSSVPPVIDPDAILFPTMTPVVIAGIPECLTRKYAADAQAYAAEWQRITAGLSADQIAEMTEIICEGIGTPPAPGSGQADAYSAQTMMIDINNGQRLDGSYNPPAPSRPVEPIQDAYYRVTRRYLESIVLSPNNELIAASSLPGELIIYRLVTDYQTILSWGTATAAAQYLAENRIAVLPTQTPTYNPIGTAQPTMTPTVTPTPPPRPTELVPQEQRGETAELCPANTLYTMGNLPEGYNPDGRLIAPVQGEALWRIEPENGQRLPDETIPLCGGGWDCKFSPDNKWILAETTNEIFVIRPDGTDQRLLYDKSKPPYPDPIYWTGPNTLEYEIYGEIPERPGRFDYLFQRDILGVFPDPIPWWPGNVYIRGLSAELISRQPGGVLALAQITFSTGINPGYEYYIYNTETKTAEYFARLADYPEESLRSGWHPFGDRLFYAYPTPPGQPTIWYQFNVQTGEHLRLGNYVGGKWSTEGRYTAYSTGRRTQQVGVYDSQTGLIRTYCLPETGARTYDGSFYWSPDSRYLALQTYLPKDESQEGVGQHTLILDVETGAVVDLSAGLGPITVWMQEPGTYGEG